MKTRIIYTRDDLAQAMQSVRMAHFDLTTAIVEVDVDYYERSTHKGVVQVLVYVADACWVNVVEIIAACKKLMNDLDYTYPIGFNISWELYMRKAGPTGDAQEAVARLVGMDACSALAALDDAEDQ